MRLVITETEERSRLRDHLYTLSQRIAVHIRLANQARDEWTAVAEHLREMDESFERRRRARLRDEFPVMAAPISFELEDTDDLSEVPVECAGLRGEQVSGGFLGETGHEVGVSSAA